MLENQTACVELQPCLQVAMLQTARQSAEKALALSKDPCRARCVELECLLQAKDAHIMHLEVLPDALQPSVHTLTNV